MSSYIKETKIMSDIQENKQRFLSRINIENSMQSPSNCLIAALRRNRTYIASKFNRQPFRRAFIKELQAQTEIYRYNVTEEEHIQTINNIAEKLSQEFGYILYQNRLRIGTVQKALNLHLKILWCLDSNYLTPPHCPVDRIVLQASNINGNWTELDSMETYIDWISIIRSYAVSAQYTSLSEWELHIWNQS